MRVTDLDWRAMFRGWSHGGNRADILYVRAVCDEVLAEPQLHRVTIIRKE
jgi:hypothetical protein